MRASVAPAITAVADQADALAANVRDLARRAADTEAHEASKALAMCSGTLYAVAIELERCGSLAHSGV